MPSSIKSRSASSAPKTRTPSAARRLGSGSARFEGEGVEPSRRTLRVLAAALPVACCAVLAPGQARADNPIVQTLFTADPAPMVYNERVYLFTTHDEDKLVGGFFTMNDWRLYSSKDIVNWTDHGSPLSYKNFTWSDGDAWAGQVVPRNGKFYFYVPINKAKVIGVAVADKIEGPYKDALGKPLVTSDCGTIDPTVYIDDDGQAYLYFGNPKLCYVKLKEDMISYSGQVEHVPMTTASFGTRQPADTSGKYTSTYEEGPWFYKRDKLYYMVFAAGPISEHIGYSTSPGPTGPWTYGGVVMATEGDSFTNHPGVIDYKGKSFFFYHNGALRPGGGGYNRSVSVEEFTYSADGKIPKMKMTKEGPAAVANLNPYDLNEAETIAWESGIETEKCSEGGMNVTDISSGDYIKVKSVDFGTGATSFTARVAAAAAGGSIQLRLGSNTGTLVGTCNVPATGGDQTWADAKCTVSGASGVKDLFFVFGGSNFKFNSWKFEGTGGGSSTGGAGGVGGVGGTTSSGGQSSIPASGGTSGTLPSTGGGPTTGGTTATGGFVATGGSPESGGSGPLVSTGGSVVSQGGSTGMVSTSGPGGSGLGGSTVTGSTVGTSGSGGARSSTAAGGAAAASSTDVGGSSVDGDESADDGSGCGCRVAGQQLPSKAAGALGLFALVALQSVRRRRRS